MDVVCQACGRRSAYRFAQPGWVCPACGAQAPLWKFVAADASLLAVRAQLAFQPTAPTGKKTRGAGGDNPLQIPIPPGSSGIRNTFLRGIQQGLDLTDRIQREAESGDGQFTALKETLLGVLEDFHRGLCGLTGPGWSIAASLLEQITAMQVLALWAAMLEDLSLHPEAWHPRAKGLKELEDQREMYFGVHHEPRHPDLLKWQEEHTRFWTREVRRKRVATGQTIQSELIASHREDPVAAETALRLCMPAQTTLLGLERSAILLTRDACRAALDLCDELRNWAPQNREQVESLQDEDVFRDILEQTEAALGT